MPLIRMPDTLGLDLGFLILDTGSRNSVFYIFLCNFGLPRHSFA